MKDAARLTLEEKVGQLFLLGFQGYTPDGEAREILENIRPGGFLLFQRNVESFDQIYELTAALGEISSVPSLLAIDQEGGRVDRLKQVFAPVPSPAELALAGTAAVRAASRVIASELEATGFNTNFAPVVDVSEKQSIAAERMLSSSPTEVARLAGAFVEEHSKKNIISCIKHFPGLGSAPSDPHFVLPRIERNKRQLQQVDLVPYFSLLDDVGMIMVGHAHYPGLGDEKPTPASLSPRVVDGLLRRKLGFQGVVVTDDLTMGAIARLGLTTDTFLRAIEAGNDMVLFSQATPLAGQAFRAVLGEAHKSLAFRRRVDESVGRILTLKNRIEFIPLRYRAHLKARIVRQIEKLRASIAVSEAKKTPALK